MNSIVFVWQVLIYRRNASFSEVSLVQCVVLTNVICKENEKVPFAAGDIKSLSKKLSKSLAF